MILKTSSQQLIAYWPGLSPMLTSPPSSPSSTEDGTCGSRKTIGRIPIVPFNIHCMEKYSLRLILHNKTGASSFADLKTVDGVLHDSFQAAAIALGLMEDDAELDKVG